MYIILGASYFRAVDDTYQYGLSARSLAIDTYTDSKEEFPDFTAFWFDTVKQGQPPFRYALSIAPALLVPISSLSIVRKIR
ncbi:glucan biosynthesis protein [Shigella sonnei]